MKVDLNDDYRLAGIIEFLSVVKSQVLKDASVVFAGYGKMVVAEYIDDCIARLLASQTSIANLKYRLKCEQEENEEYRQRYGDIDDIEEEKENEP